MLSDSKTPDNMFIELKQNKLTAYCLHKLQYTKLEWNLKQESPIIVLFFFRHTLQIVCANKVMTVSNSSLFH